MGTTPPPPPLQSNGIKEIDRQTDRERERDMKTSSEWITMNNIKGIWNDIPL